MKNKWLYFLVAVFVTGCSAPSCHDEELLNQITDYFVPRFNAVGEYAFEKGALNYKNHTEIDYSVKNVRKLAYLGNELQCSADLVLSYKGKEISTSIEYFQFKNKNMTTFGIATDIKAQEISNLLFKVLSQTK